MSQNLRDMIHDYVESNLTDDRFDEIAEILSEAGDQKHSIPITIKVGFSTSEEGSTMKIGHSINLKAVEWDVPVKLSGRQMDLFAPRSKTRTRSITNSPGAEPAEPDQTTTPEIPVEDTRPEEHKTEAPEKESPLPGLSMRQEEPAPPAEPKTQEERLSAIQNRNQALLAKVDSGELQLSPQAEKALREQAEAEA